MNKKRNWAIAVVISAAAGVFALQTVFAPTSEDLPVQPATTVPTATHTPTPAYEGCGYMWAYHDDMELSARINDAIQTINPSASARAQLFGEDCVYADGHATFTAMETDFYVQLPVEDLTADEEFGNWIKQVMDLIIELPQEDIAGRKGFTEFSFIQDEKEQIILRVTIDDYLNNPPVLSGSELFREFHTPIPASAVPAPITPTPTP